MRRKFILFLSTITISFSIIYPLFIYQGSERFFSEKVLLAVGLLVTIIGLTFCSIMFLNKKRGKGTIYLAYDFSELEFVNDLKDALSAQHYNCFPDISSLLAGSQVKNLNLDVQLSKADLLIVLLSKDSADSNYINYIVKFFKRLNKPIQIYSFTGPDTIPPSLKQYIIFPLPNQTQQAIAMVTDLVNASFLRNK